MKQRHRYLGQSRAASGAAESAVSFSPDTLREPTYFSGRLRRHLPFREAMGALHDVVTGDLGPRPADNADYQAWAKEQEERDVEAAIAERAGLKERIQALHHELLRLAARRSERWGPFWRARQRYYDYLWHHAKDAWMVLDPVITVHPDEVFFECLSLDTSTYGRLSASHGVFDDVGELAFGTTNVDYSAGLYREVQKIRSYKETRFEIDRAGFDVKTEGQDLYTEVKVDLPDSWVRGFLQVSSAMTLDAAVVELHPMDVHNLCFVLRRKKEKKGPRSLRWQLEPGKPARVVVEPWNTVVACPRSRYTGTEPVEIRTWGRRRLLVLERLIPKARSFTAHLLGYGMPSFFVADLDGLTFTLGLSGWTANDWATEGNFDLLAPRGDVDDDTRARVFEALREVKVANSADLAASLGLDVATVESALQGWVQAGRAVYDLARGVWRCRELMRDPVPLASLRFASPREEEAASLVAEKRARLVAERAEPRGRVRLSGTVKVDTGQVRAAGSRRGGRPKKELEVSCVIDADERLVEARCTCPFYRQNRLRRGPCAHVLALRRLRGQARGGVLGRW